MKKKRKEERKGTKERNKLFVLFFWITWSDAHDRLILPTDSWFLADEDLREVERIWGRSRGFEGGREDLKEVERIWGRSRGFEGGREDLKEVERIWGRSRGFEGSREDLREVERIWGRSRGFEGGRGSVLACLWVAVETLLNFGQVKAWAEDDWEAACPFCLLHLSALTKLCLSQSYDWAFWPMSANCLGLRFLQIPLPWLVVDSSLCLPRNTCRRHSERFAEDRKWCFSTSSIQSADNS